MSLLTYGAIGLCALCVMWVAALIIAKCIAFGQRDDPW